MLRSIAEHVAELTSLALFVTMVVLWSAVAAGISIPV